MPSSPHLLTSRLSQPVSRPDDSERVHAHVPLLEASPTVGHAQRQDVPAFSSVWICKAKTCLLLMALQLLLMTAMLLWTSSRSSAPRPCSQLRCLSEAQPVAVPTVRTWQLNASQPRYAVDLLYPKGLLPHKFWYQRVNPTEVDAIADPVPLSLIVHAGSYNAALGGFQFIVSLEWQPNLHFDIPIHSYQYNTQAWEWDRPAFLELRSRLRCRLPLLDEVERPVLSLTLRFFSMEITCPWAQHPWPPPNELRVQLRLSLDPQAAAEVRLPLTSAVEPVVQHALCTQVRGTAALHHNFDWVSYHLALGFQLLVVSDRLGVMRELLQPYIDDGAVIYRHAPELPGDVVTYDQVLEMEFCRYRLQDRASWIAHWDTDEWLALPAGSSGTAGIATCIRTAVLSSYRLAAYQAAASAQQMGVRDYSLFPVLFVQQNRRESCDSPLQSFLETQLRSALNWSRALEYEAVVLPRLLAQTRDPRLMQYQRDAAGASANNRSEVYIYMPQLVPNTTRRTAPELNAKWMTRARAQAEYSVHGPMYRHWETRETQRTPEALPTTSAHLVHFANFYISRRADDVVDLTPSWVRGAWTTLHDEAIAASPGSV